ncbi:hypothetical protein, partial [Isoptericola sp. QY 916]|uniref:hypothetical protein n=1 Tax=Isoptericola sp. QY 916 TaxID=2782570 RepID=UPI003D2FB5D9|nr:hypothetical protein [Isoptericola sp. QY 916]
RTRVRPGNRHRYSTYAPGRPSSTDGTVTVLDAPVVASGRRELLAVVREQAVSRTRHRYGHVHA